jgi:pilus assembly protein Flp/PilA
MLAYIRKVADRKSDEGASAVEYGLLVAAIAAVIVLIVFALGSVVKGAFQDTCNNIADKDSSAATSSTASCK